MHVLSHGALNFGHGALNFGHGVLNFGHGALNLCQSTTVVITKQNAQMKNIVHLHDKYGAIRTSVAS